MRHDTTGLVEKYERSGLTQKDYCRQNSVSYATLQYHLKKRRRLSKADTIPDTASRFVPVDFSHFNADTDEVTIVVIRGRMNPARIAEIVHTVSRT